MNSRASWIRIALAVLALGALLAPAAALGKKKHKQHAPKREPSPLVIGHRGASGFVPEHTLQSYRLAIKLGADYVEPDLVSTKDGVLIARHEPILGDSDSTTTGDSTNVGDHLAEFGSRETTRMLDGVATTGFWASDFTLAEIKTLRARQTRSDLPRPTQFDGQFEVPTLQEIIDLVKRQSRKRGRKIGIYPETKHPTFHDSIGLSLEEKLVRILKRNGLNRRSARVFIQSFEQSNLKQLNGMTPVRLVQLMDANDTDANGNPTYAPPFDRPYDWTASGDPTLMSRTFGYFATDPGLDEVKTYADAIGPWKVYIIPTTGGGGGDVKPPTDLVQRAHARGLLVHTWTFRDDSFPTGYAGGPVEEYLNIYRQGVDGVFSDFPDTAFAARLIFLHRI
jgi:glycerophosphoryl diester phosphodiesterase